MKILALTSVYPQKDDGKDLVTATVQYFCEKWVELGHEVVVIHSNSCFPRPLYWIPDKQRTAFASKFGFNLPTKESRKKLTIKKERLTVYRLPVMKAIPHGKFSDFTISRQLKMIRSLLNNQGFKPDVIVSHWVNPQIDLLEPLGKEYNAKTSLVFHDDCSERNIERFRLEKRVKNLDAIGCRSRSYAEYVKERLHLDKKPFICYSGIPDELADARENEFSIDALNNKPEYIYVGRLVKFKNVDVIVEALHQYYGNCPFKFHIVGSGAEETALKKMAVRYGMGDKVIFHGQMQRIDVFELMKKCKCFIMVSQHETFGMVYIEAMLAGCITIASKGGGVDGIIVDGVNGYLSEEGDPLALANKIRSICKLNLSKRIELRKKAIRTACEFSDSNVAKVYLGDVMSWKSID